MIVALAIHVSNGAFERTSRREWRTGGAVRASPAESRGAPEWHERVARRPEDVAGHVQQTSQPALPRRRQAVRRDGARDTLSRHGGGAHRRAAPHLPARRTRPQAVAQTRASLVGRRVPPVYSRRRAATGGRRRPPAARRDRPLQSLRITRMTIDHIIKLMIFIRTRWPELAPIFRLFSTR